MTIVLRALTISMIVKPQHHTQQCHRVYSILEPLAVLKLLCSADATAAVVVVRVLALLLS
jgi:hypothetical protein